MNKLLFGIFVFFYSTLSCCNYPSPVKKINSFSLSECAVTSYRTGSDTDLQTETKEAIVLMGGGKDVDLAFRQMIKDSGKGDFVIIRASGADGYNDYLYSELGGPNSVETLIIDSREKAFCPTVAEKIRKAEALFIAGGDQAKYYLYWKDTPVQNSIEYLVNAKKVPIGGTSAGMAIMSELVYTAEVSSLTSEKALKNPLSEEVTIKNDFLKIPLLKNILTDTHFDQRKRQGRTIAFMANVLTKEMIKEVKTVAADENTALYIDDDNQAEVLGSGKIWLFQAENGLPERCIPSQPLHWKREKKAIKVTKTTGKFNFADWSSFSGDFSVKYFYVENGRLSD